MSGTTDTQQSEYIQPAMAHPASHFLFWGVAGAMLWVDLWSKNWIFSNLDAHEIRPIIEGLFDFRRSLNTGAVFGSFTGQTTIFIIASLFAFAFVVYLFLNSSCKQRGLHIALALILSGAVGNLYDRAFVVADVIDFRSRTGEPVSFVGSIVSDTDAKDLLVGDFPEGTNPRRFDPDQVDVRSQGVVRDFIKFVPKFPEGMPKWGGRDMWPWVFNVADAALVIGVILLLFHTWFDRAPHGSRE